MKTFKQWMESGLFHQKYNPTGINLGADAPGEVAGDAAEEGGFGFHNLARYFEMVRERLSHLWPEETNRVKSAMWERAGKPPEWQWRQTPDGQLADRVSMSMYAVQAALKRQYNSLRKYKNIDHSLAINYKKGLSKALTDAATLFASSKSNDPDLQNLIHQCHELVTTAKRDIDVYVSRFQPPQGGTV